jgi:cytidine deaminase
MGGTYWDSEEPDFRDVKLGFDPNDVLKNEILRDLFDRLGTGGLLSEKAKAVGSLDEMVKEFTRKRKPGTSERDGVLAHSAIMDDRIWSSGARRDVCDLRCCTTRKSLKRNDVILYDISLPQLHQAHFGCWNKTCGLHGAVSEE